MSVSVSHVQALPSVPLGPDAGEIGWRSLRLDLPEAAILLKVPDARGERALIELRPSAASREIGPGAMQFPLTLGPDIAARLVCVVDDIADGALAGLPVRPEIRRLGAALVAARSGEQLLQLLYAQSIGSVIAAQVIEQARSRPARRTAAPLPKWRLTRVVRYVEENIAERLSLAELAAKAGLTRMYFAAQFRASTGLSPHAYVLRLRIERAQEMLEETNETLVNVALNVGFQTQAHFTTVFKRFVGETPARWRQARAGARQAAFVCRGQARRAVQA